MKCCSLSDRVSQCRVSSIRSTSSTVQKTSLCTCPRWVSARAQWGTAQTSRDCRAQHVDNYISENVWWRNHLSAPKMLPQQSKQARTCEQPQSGSTGWRRGWRPPLHRLFSSCSSAGCAGGRRASLHDRRQHQAPSAVAHTKRKSRRPGPPPCGRLPPPPPGPPPTRPWTNPYSPPCHTKQPSGATPCTCIYSHTPPVAPPPLHGRRPGQATSPVVHPPPPLISNVCTDGATRPCRARQDPDVGPPPTPDKRRRNLQYMCLFLA